MLKQLKLTITEDKFNELYEQLIKNNIGQKNSWFETEEEFDEWAGDILYDLLDQFVEKGLGIEYIDN